MPDEREFTTVEELPDDPLAMPPPYWRSTAAIFHILAALETLCGHLSKLLPVLARTNRRLDRHYEKYPDRTDESSEEFGRICDQLWKLEHSINLETERAIFMSAIATEDEINQFSVFNLQRDIAETIEKLSPPEKLLMISGILGKPSVKGTAVYEKAKKLNAWRNAFAHGHCVDRPTKSLRHNHLISPQEYPGPPSVIRDVLEFVGAFLSISGYLRSISLNKYTAGTTVENQQVEKLLSTISRYSFKGDNTVYSVNHRRVRVKANRVPQVAR